MSTVRIALANLRYAATPDESVALAQAAVEQASVEGALIVCFPECYVPGYRAIGRMVPPIDEAFLESAGGQRSPAWRQIRASRWCLEPNAWSTARRG